MKRSVFGVIRVTLMAFALGTLFCFPARAEFGSTDSSNLNTIKNNTNTISSNVSSIQSYVNYIYTRLATTNDALSDILDQATNIEENTDEIKRALTGSSSPLTQIKDTLVGISNKIDSIKTSLELLPLVYGHLNFDVCQTTNSYTFNLNNTTYTLPLIKINIGGTNYYANFRGQLAFYLNSLYCHITQNYAQASDQTQPTAKVITFNDHPVMLFRSYMDQFSYTPNTDVISSTRSYYYFTFFGYIRAFFFTNLDSKFNANVAYIADTFYRYYNPRVVPASNYFWYAYNTDTQQYDSTNLAGLMQYITWYLGQMYVLQTENDALEDLAESVDTAASTFEDFNEKEQDVIDQISTGFESFLPDDDLFESFEAITWCSNYLQRVYLALGSYGTVIFIALLFGVCLQFIGYFRYK